MVTNILNSVKTFLSLDLEENIFDEELLINIGTCLGNLNQLGLPSSDIEITSETDYNQLFPNDNILKNLGRSYFCNKTKSMFDPSPNKTVNESLSNQILELESRITIHLSLKELEDQNENSD